MKTFAIVTLLLGVVGAGLSWTAAAGPLQFEAFGHSVEITVNIGSVLRWLSLSMLAGGVALWLYAVQREQAKRDNPDA